jgi:hypothetical protein
MWFDFLMSHLDWRGMCAWVRSLPLVHSHECNDFGVSSYDFSHLNKNSKYLHPYVLELMHQELAKRGVFLHQELGTHARELERIGTESGASRNASSSTLFSAVSSSTGCPREAMRGRGFDYLDPYHPKQAMSSWPGFNRYSSSYIHQMIHQPVFNNGNKSSLQQGSTFQSGNKIPIFRNDSVEHFGLLLRTLAKFELLFGTAHEECGTDNVAGMNSRLRHKRIQLDYVRYERIQLDCDSEH